MIWENKWNNPGTYRLLDKPRETDPYDENTTYRGNNGRLWIENGVMSLSGHEPRFYVNIEVQNVDVSLDYMRIGTDGSDWGGCAVGVRSDVEGHNSESGKNAHTYYFRLRHDNKVDIYRELVHGTSGEILISKYSPINIKPNNWYAYKFRCYNLDNGVKLEGYINNELVLEYIDNNQIMYNSRGVCFVRNTDIKESRYKNMVIRSSEQQPEFESKIIEHKLKVEIKNTGTSDIVIKQGETFEYIVDLI